VNHQEEGGQEIGENHEAVLMALAIGVMIIFLAAVQIGPGRVRKPFKKDRK